ncbi:MAG TPA: dTMP kinase [Saprospiraceae bacterium]|jgi:dTMP kinase|nr:dTMP kinase [Saprospiraceae bacterium]HRO09555.1 dTMP kinase [Saprospiraceae bacterium]HRO73099.1 dTMP kinase [Saprospiraceae bacterium]HRP41185.1 dTMP kinase [Saprospiraceae bacterium]
MNRRGKFIAFEGIDGSGKSTQVKKLTAFLRAQGHNIHSTFEPTDSPIGKIIRDIFNHQMEGDQRVIAALFVADRLNHLLNTTDGMLKKIEEGYIVITDRYYLSSYAYHSIHGIDLDWVIQANSLSAGLLRPDVHLFIDTDPEQSIDRLIAGRDNIEMYENLSTLKKVQQMYYDVFKKVGSSENIRLINGNRSVDAIFEDVLHQVRLLL